MTLAHTLSMALLGIEGHLVEVEADLANGLPATVLIGLPDAALHEARDRVRAAVVNSGHAWPQRRVTLGLSPASLPKAGSHFDLAIAVAVLAAAGELPTARLGGVVLLGELGLDGRLRGVRGVLPAVLAAARLGLARVGVPLANLPEARLVPGIEATGLESLRSALAWLGGTRAGSQALPAGRAGRDRGRAASSVTPAGCDPSHPDSRYPDPGHPDPGHPDPSHPDPGHPDSRYPDPGHPDPGHPDPGHPDWLAAGSCGTGWAEDLADVAGQPLGRRAVEVAAAGGHHLLLLGPPGAGKTMLAERLPGLLPPLDLEAALEVTAVHSVAGILAAGAPVVTRPPFRRPHHTATLAALVGGGSGLPRPGAASCAHRGVLFLDEAPEFAAGVLDALRQPLESGWIEVSRARATTRFPARFLLVLAANPCPCGAASAHCSCSPLVRRRYLGRLSGPLLDRVDLQVLLPAVSGADLRADAGLREPTRVVAERVRTARERAAQRLRGTPWRLCAEVPAAELRRRWPVPAAAARVVERAVELGQLSARGLDRVCRLAWTIADLAGHESPGPADVGEALALRTLGSA